MVSVTEPALDDLMLRAGLRDVEVSRALISDIEFRENGNGKEMPILTI